jgi:hypothetical protein
MIRRRRSAGPRGRGGVTAGVDQGAYQVDVMMALFSILLILLLTSLASAQGEPQRPSRSDYRPSDRPTANFQLRSMASIYPFRDVWVAKDGMLYGLDLTWLAQHYLAAGSLRLEEWLEPVDLSIAPASEHLDSFVLKLGFSGTGVPAGLAAQRIPLTDADAAVAALSRGAHGALIYAWSDGAAGLAPILARLRAAGVCHKLVLDPRRQTLALSRDYGLFAAEAVLRCY